MVNVKQGRRVADEAVHASWAGSPPTTIYGCCPPPPGISIECHSSLPLASSYLPLLYNTLYYYLGEREALTLTRRKDPRGVLLLSPGEREMRGFSDAIETPALRVEGTVL